MLPLLGLGTIVVLLAAILSKRMSPLVALIIVPIAASLIGGFGLHTSKFVIDGLKGKPRPSSGCSCSRSSISGRSPTPARSTRSSTASCARSARGPRVS